MGYLDNTGLTKLWAKIKAYVDDKVTGDVSSQLDTTECNSLDTTNKTVIGAINELNSNLEIKNIHISGTPNWQGCIKLGLSTENNEFVLAIIGSRYEIYYFAYLQNWYAKVMKNDVTYSPINADAVEFDVLYIVLP